MKKSFLPVLILAVLGAILPNWRLDGAPLRESDVCEGATWFAHVDFDALRTQKDWEKTVPFLPLDAPKFVEMQKESGFDLRKNLTGLTISGIGKGDDLVFVLRHNLPSTDKIAAWAVAQLGLEHKGGTIYGPKKKRKGFLDFVAPGVILAAENFEELAKARKRFEATKTPPLPALFNDLAKAKPENRPMFSVYFASTSTNIPSDLWSAISPAPKHTKEFAVLFGKKGDALQLDLCAKLYGDDKIAAKIAGDFNDELAKVISGETRLDEDPKWKDLLPILKRVKVSAKDQAFYLSADAATSEFDELVDVARKLLRSLPMRPELRQPRPQLQPTTP